MNRWTKAAILCAIAAAVGNASPVTAGINNTGVMSQNSAVSVKNFFPGDMDTNVAPDTPLTAEFAGAVDQSFYQSVNFNLFTGTSPVPGELFYNPAARQVMFKPKASLTEGQTYTVQLSYFDGLGRTVDKVWSFQTNSGNNRMPSSATVNTAAANSFDDQSNAKALVLTNANMGSGLVSAETPLEISFSEAIDIAALKTAPVQLFANNKPVGIDYKLSRDMKTLTISPRESLKSSVSYAVAVDRTLCSASGARLAKKTLIPFKLEGSGNEILVERHVIEERPAPASKSYSNQYEDMQMASRTTAAMNQQAVQNYSNNQQYAAQAPVQAQPQAQMMAQAPQQAAYAPVQQSAQVQLIGLAPQNGSRITNLSQPVTIGFSDEILPDTLNEFTFRLEDDFGPVPAKIHYFQGQKQATLTPVGLLDSNKTYRVVVTQGVSDVYGRPIRTGINSTFATISPVAAPAAPVMTVPVMTAQAMTTPVNDAAELESFENSGYASQRQPVQTYAAETAAQQAARSNYAAPADRTVQIMPQNSNAVSASQVKTAQKQSQPQLNGFKVTSIYPGANSDNIARKAKIAVHFSEDADPKTVNNINISVFGNQTRVDGRVVYDRKNKRAIFEPESQLDAKTEYKVIVSDKIKSKLGEQLCQRFSWEFSTTESASRQYVAKAPVAEADASFYIPLVDSKVKPNRQQLLSNDSTRSASGNNSGSFTFVPSKHWSFKSMRHISSKGILDAFPFNYTDNVTRYEFATAISNALSNLKGMQSAGKNPRLRVADMVELEKLIIEYRGELKTYNVNSVWFESFLQQQGVNLQQVEQKVTKLNRG